MKTITNCKQTVYKNHNGILCLYYFVNDQENEVIYMLKTTYRNRIILFSATLLTLLTLLTPRLTQGPSGS